MCGYVWLWVALGSYVGLCVNIDGYGWLCVAICVDRGGYGWLCVTRGGYVAM